MAQPALTLAVMTFVFTASLGAQQSTGASADALLDKASTDFLAGRISDAVSAFDRAVALDPRLAPELWQRGMALYYAGRYRDCRTQFEQRRQDRPADVENAVWHFLCVARSESPARARALLLPVGQDEREPMREVYRLFAGTMSPESVLVAGVTDLRARFYAILYVGLYLEAMGEKRAELYIKEAASDQYASVGGVMNQIAKVHVQVRGWR